jgi:biotin carboxyl carrier protein
MLGRPFCYNVHIMKQTYQYQDGSFSIELKPTGSVFQASNAEKAVSVKLIRQAGNRLELLLDGNPCTAIVSRLGSKRWVTIKGQTFELNALNTTRGPIGQAQHPAGQLTARMPGLVRAVHVAENDLITKGQTLAVIEAMKMENKLTAPFDGRIKKLMIQVGQTVEKEQVLMEITEPQPPAETTSNPLSA